MVRYIENRKDLSFVSRVLTLIDAHIWNQGADLRAQLDVARQSVRRANAAFDNTYNMPCGYQDAAGDRAEQAGRDYMVLVHAYLACRYGALTKRFSAILETALPAQE